MLLINLEILKLLDLIEDEGGIPLKIKEDNQSKETIEIDENVSREEARDKIIEFLKDTPQEIIYPSDVFEELKLPYELISEIMENLESEEYLEEA